MASTSNIKNNKNSEDELLPEELLGPTENADLKNVKISMDSKGNNKNVLVNNSPSTSNSTAFPNQNKSLKLREFLSAVDKTSFRKDGEVVHTPVIYDLFDYESDDNAVDSSLPSVSKVSAGNTTKNTTTEDVRFRLFEDESSSSDSEEEFNRRRIIRGCKRARNDKDTAESFEQFQQSISNFLKLKKSLDNPTNSSQQSDHLNTSSENCSVYKIAPITSDSSDSDTPVTQQQVRKRNTITSSSEESDMENINVTQPAHGRGSPNQNELPRGIVFDLPDTMAQIQRNFSWSDSFTDDILRNVLRGENMDSSESDEQSSSLVANTSTIGSRRRNDKRGNLTNSTTERVRVSSTNGNRYCSKIIRFRRSPPRQGRGTNLLFEPRRVTNAQIYSSDSDSHNEQTLSDGVNNSSTSNTDVSPNSLIPFKTEDENLSDFDADSEKCPICYRCFHTQEVASPGPCDHSFCSKCIQEWALNNNTCPIDRKPFTELKIRRFFDERVLRVMHVPDPFLISMFSI